jgi:hypothetical protein
VLMRRRRPPPMTTTAGASAGSKVLISVAQPLAADRQLMQNMPVPDCQLLLPPSPRHSMRHAYACHTSHFLLTQVISCALYRA